MEVLVFKTNVKDIEQVNSISHRLNEALGFRKWNFDLDDCDKIFRVEVLTTPSNEIINLFDSLGYYCEELL